MNRDINFYILNRDGLMSTVLSSAKTGKHTPILNAGVEEKLDSYDLLTLTIPADDSNADKIREDYTIIFQDIKGWREYVVTNVEEVDGEETKTTVTAELSSIELLDEILTVDSVSISNDPRLVLERILEGTRWTVGTVDESIYNSSFNQDVKYMNVLEAVDKLSSSYSCEVAFSYTKAGNVITGRYVNLYKQVGQDRGKRFEIDKDVTEIKRTINTADIKTAVIPYGKEQEQAEDETQAQAERVTITDLVWSTANGDPIDKPAGQEYLGDTEALQRWGKINTDGTRRHRFLALEIDAETADEVASIGWVSLGKYTKPKATYEATVMDLYVLTGDEDLLHEHVNLGDTSVVIDRYFTEPLMIQVRVVEQKRDLLDPMNNEIVLGDSKESFRVGNVEDTVKDLQSKVSQASYQASYAQLTGGSVDSYGGSVEPVDPNEGDTWYRPHPVEIDETQYLRFDGTIWNVVVDTSELAQVKSTAETASTDAGVAIKDAETAVKTAETAENGLLTKVENDVYTSKISQIEDNINLRVEENDVVNQINISSEAILIDGNNLHITATTTIDNAVITSAMIQNLTADKITAGTIDAGVINVVNLTADNITGGDLNAKNVRIMNGATPVMTVSGTTNEVEMNVSKLTINTTDVETEFADTRTYAEEQAGTAESNANTYAEEQAGTAETNAKEYADLTVEDLVVGGANLLLDSKVAYANSSYPTASYDLTEPIQDGEQVTFRLKGNLATTKTAFKIFNSGGTVSLATLVADGNGYYKATFNWVVGGSTNSFINVYPIQNAEAGESSIEWVQLERGSKATDYSLASEEIQAMLDTKANDNDFKTLTGNFGKLSEEVTNETVHKTEYETFKTSYRDRVGLAEGKIEDTESEMSKIDGRTATIEGKFNDGKVKWEFIDTTISQSDNGLLVSNGPNDTGVLVKDDKILFMDGGIEVAEITGQHMQINHGIFVKSAQIGKHKIETLPNSNVTVVNFIG